MGAVNLFASAGNVPMRRKTPRSNKAVVEDTRMEDRPSFVHMEASGVPEASALQDMRFVRKTSRPQAAAGLLVSILHNRKQPIGLLYPLLCLALWEHGTPHPIIEEPPTTDPDNTQDDGMWTPDHPPVDGKQYLRVYINCCKGMIGLFI